MIVVSECSVMMRAAIASASLSPVTPYRRESPSVPRKNLSMCTPLRLSSSARPTSSNEPRVESSPNDPHLNTGQRHELGGDVSGVGDDGDPFEEPQAQRKLGAVEATAHCNHLTGLDELHGMVGDGPGFLAVDWELVDRQVIVT